MLFQNVFLIKNMFLKFFLRRTSKWTKQFNGLKKRPKIFRNVPNPQVWVKRLKSGDTATLFQSLSGKAVASMKNLKIVVQEEKASSDGRCSSLSRGESRKINAFNSSKTRLGQNIW